MHERRKAVAPVVEARRFGQHRPYPHVVRLVRIVQGFDHPRHPADAALDRAGAQPGVALEDARRDQMDERVHDRRHGVRHVVDQRAAVAADRARVATGRYVESERQAGFFDQRPERLERLVVVLKLSVGERPEDGFGRQGQALEPLRRGPGDFGQRPVEVARGDHGHRHEAVPVVAERLVRPAVPGAEHRALKHRVGRPEGQQSLVRKDDLRVHPVRVGIGQPRGHVRAGMVAAQVVRLEPLRVGLEHVHVLERLQRGQMLLGVAPRLHEQGFHALADRPLRPVDVRFHARNAVPVCRFDTRLQIVVRFDAVRIDRHHVIFIRVPGPRGPRPAGRAGRFRTPRVAGGCGS